MLAKLVVGLTITITLSVGPYVVSLAHTVGGETRVSHAVEVGGIQKGQSRCVRGCPLDSKTQNFETLDMSAPDLIALNANRTDGEFTADVGVYKNASLPTGKLGLGLGLSASATKQIDRKDFIKLLNSQYIKRFLPQSIARRIKDYEVRNNLSFPTKKRETVTFVRGVGLTNKFGNDWVFVSREEMRKQADAEAAWQRLLQDFGKPTLNRLPK